MMKPVVSFYNVSKTYSLFKKKSDQLLDVFSFKKNKKDFFALSNISFEVYKGETIGIIGVNGSGKSTLSSILAQVTPPTSGNIEIDGETSLVAISAGLNNHLTGLENIQLKCLMHGMKKRDIRKLTPDIIEFADIGDFIDQPIKSYSSGMKSRLGFAISVHIQPDILVVDEALSVGDTTFYQKCLDKFDEFKAEGKTIFFISHSLPQVQSISDRIMWLNFGRIEKFDENAVVVHEYNKFIKWFNDLNKQEKKEYRKKMLNTQIGKGNEYEKNISPYIRKRTRKKNKWHSFLNSLQFSLILLYFLASIMLMFVENPVIAIKNGINSFNDGKVDSTVNNNNKNIVEETNPNNHIDINQDGIVNTRLVTIFKDEELKNNLIDLLFSTQIYIEEKIDNSIYKVRISNGIGYVESEKITPLDKEISNSKLTIENFLPILPEEFADSYDFFFSFLNTEIDEVKKSVKGSKEAYKNEFEQELLVYTDLNISYMFNENQVSEAIEIKDIDLNDFNIDNVTSKASFVSEEDNLYYFLIRGYEVCLDINNRSITFRITE